MWVAVVALVLACLALIIVGAVVRVLVALVDALTDDTPARHRPEHIR